MKKALKKILFILFSAVLGCCFLVGCMSTKIQVTYMVGNQQYAVQEYELNEQISLPTAPTSEGEEFIGWYTDSALTQPYAEGKITAGLTLYAKFETSVVYIIVNTDGGEKISPIAVSPGGEYEVPAAQKEGYTFMGYYYVDANGDVQDFPISGAMPGAESIQITARYEINKYTVTLNDGVSEEPETVEVEYNKTYTPRDGVRLGYTFVAWHTVEENQTEETVYDATQPVKDNVVLYAQYTANNYKITVANNVDSTTETVDVTYDAEYALTAADKTGYTFGGYTFNGEEFAAKGAYTYAQNIRITANYSKNAYPVTFKDAATGEEIVTRNVEHGNKVSEPTADLAKVGYTYTLSADLNNAITQATEILVTYTANPYKITITNNVNNSTQVVDVVYNGAYTLSANAITGYTFANFTFDGEEFNASATYGYTHNITVMANYTLNKYAVTFKDAATGDVLATQEVAHGGKVVEPALSRVGYTYTLSADLNDAITEATEITVTYTAKTAVVTVIGAQDGYTLPTIVFGEKFTLVAPTRLGYNFEGFTGSDGKTYEADVEYTCDFESLTLTAQFDGDEKLVTFMANGVQVSQATVLSGYKASRPATDPSVDGYTFKGWSTKADELVAYNFDATVTNDITLYAYFEANEYQITIDLDGGTGATNLSVTYGGSYTLTAPTKKGYIFAGYEANGSTFALTGTYNVVGNTAIKATWTADNKTVTFHANDEVYTTETVLNGYTVAAPATAPTKAGYTFKGWYTSEAYTNAYVFTTEVTANLDLYAKFEANTYTITINLNGGTGIATSMTVTYNAHYDLSTLGTPSKLGYIFNGYDIETEGTYTVVGNTEATVQWTADNKTVVFEADGVETEVTVLNGFAVSRPATDPTKTGYTFQGWYDAQGNLYDFSAAVTTDIMITAKFTVNTYTLTIDNAGGKGDASFSIEYNAAYNLSEPTRNGYEFTGYVNENGEAFALSGKYTYASNVTITATWEAVLINNGDHFIDNQNGQVYVYLAGHTYNFTNTELTIGSFASGDASCVTIGGDYNAQLVAIAPCEFTVTVNKYDVNGNVIDTYTRTMKIVEEVANFIAGEDYRNAWVNRNTSNFDNNSKNDAMLVGRSDYRPDVKVQKLVDDTLVSISLAAANVEVEVLADGVATTDYTLNGDSFTFNENLIGKTITLTMAPRYAIYSSQTLTVSFVLNNGVNVYTNEELKTAYVDASVSEINILRNITAQLDDSQINIIKAGAGTNGDVSFDVAQDTIAPINRARYYDANGNELASSNGSATSKGGRAVYDRFSGTLKVNGNYFTVNGGEIPLVDNRDGDRGFNPNQQQFILHNVQFSLFKFGVEENGSTDTLTMENLYIVGNMNRATNWGENDGETYQVTGTNGAKNVLTMSGAAIGVQIRSGHLNMNNVTIRRSLFAVGVYGDSPRTTVNAVGTYHASTLNAVDCIFENSWANNLYTWGFGAMTLNSSYVGASSGAAIHFDAKAGSSTSDANCRLILTNGTKIENWVTGEETWFRVYAMVDTAAGLKVQAETLVQGATGALVQMGQMQKTKSLLDSTGQKINFAVLIRAGTGDYDDWVADPQKQPVLDTGDLVYPDMNGYVMAYAASGDQATAIQNWLTANDKATATAFATGEYFKFSNLSDGGANDTYMEGLVTMA